MTKITQSDFPAVFTKVESAKSVAKGLSIEDPTICWFVGVNMTDTGDGIFTTYFKIFSQSDLLMVSNLEWNIMFCFQNGISFERI